MAITARDDAKYHKMDMPNIPCIHMPNIVDIKWLLMGCLLFLTAQLYLIIISSSNSLINLQSIEISYKEHTLSISAHYPSNTVPKPAIDILLCAESKYRFQMYTLINSIILNEHIADRSRLNFHILILRDIPLFEQEFDKHFGLYMDEISVEFASIMDDNMGCFAYYKVASSYVGRKVRRLNNPMNFARFCLPYIFPKVNVAIYLDVDMIVQGRISQLYEYYDMYNYAALTVMNRDPPESFKSPMKSLYINHYLNNDLHAIFPSVVSTAIDLANVTQWSNAGVMMFNLKIWRKYKLSLQALRLFEFNRAFRAAGDGEPAWYGATQALPNMLWLINGESVGNLPPSWNYVVKDQIGCHSVWGERYERGFSEANIIHWAGACKPWAEDNVSSAFMWTKYIPPNTNITEWEQEFGVSLSHYL